MSLDRAPDVPLASVKWRVQGRPTNGRAQFVPYVDAYEVARLLDGWVGAENWKDDYTEAHGKGLWGHVSIRVEGEWITKTDKGVPSNMEAEKGEVSDAFKRAACLKWGVAGNVYRLPTLWAPCDERTNNKGEKVAYPNAQTIPAIIAELTKRGFSDADAADATADHDEDPEPARTVLAGWLNLREQDEAHSDFRETVSACSEDVQAHMRDFRKERGLPWPMPREQLDEMLEELASAQTVRIPDNPEFDVDEPTAAEKRKARAEQVANEAGLSDQQRLLAKADDIKERGRARKGTPPDPAMAAAGDKG